MMKPTPRPSIYVHVTIRPDGSYKLAIRIRLRLTGEAGS
jgi:hypothetical protein